MRAWATEQRLCASGAREIEYVRTCMRGGHWGEWEMEGMVRPGKARQGTTRQRQDKTRQDQTTGSPFSCCRANGSAQLYLLPATQPPASHTHTRTHTPSRALSCSLLAGASTSSSQMLVTGMLTPPPPQTHARNPTKPQ